VERALMLRLSDIAKALSAEFTGAGDTPVSGINHPALAGPDEMALAMEEEALKALAGSRARTAILLPGKNGRSDLAGTIVAAYPRYALAGLTKLFARPPRSAPGVHASAVIDPSAQVALPTSIGAFTQVGADARIGPRATILGQVTIGAGVRIGSDALIYPGVRIGDRVEIGDRVILHPNASIGADGFSFAIPEPAKPSPPGQAPIQRIASLGTVIIGHDVEIGANSCIDRGTIEATTIGNSTKIDNLVMIAHNNQIGENCMIAGRVGISGSCRIGNGVIMAGGAGIADHMRIGDGAVILAAAAVGGSRVPPGAVVVGMPAISRERFLDQLKNLYRLKRLFADVAALKARMNIADSPAAED
jgi:UDP-3-O-[3-hydroxymyristoyl] glucosamine N-acyltransferase